MINDNESPNNFIVIINHCWYTYNIIQCFIFYKISHYANYNIKTLVGHLILLN